MGLFLPQSSSAFAKASAGEAGGFGQLCVLGKLCSQSKLLPRSIAFVHGRLGRHSFALSRLNKRGFCTGILVYAYILMECFKNRGFWMRGIWFLYKHISICIYAYGVL